MTSAVVNPSGMTADPLKEQAAVKRGAFDLDWQKVVRFGGLLGLALVFVSLCGMAVGLDSRQILYWVNPDVYVSYPDGVGLSLGYIALFMWPLLLGWAFGNEVVLEGMTATKRGARDLVAGFSVGAIGGLVVVLLTFLMGLDREVSDAGAALYGLRDPLVNWKEELYVLLTFNRGWTFALWAWPVLAGLLTMFGAGMRLVPTAIRKAIVAAALAIVAISIFQFLIDDVIEGVGETINDPGRLGNFFGDPTEGRPRVDSVFDPLIDFVYTKTGGLRLQGMILIGVVTAALSLIASYVTRGRFKTARKAYFDKPMAERTLSTSILLFVTALVLIIVPFFAGKIANELFANVGIFLLLALGLNIVVGLAGILDLGYVAFFAVGGYTTAVLTSAGRGESWPSWVPLFVTDDGNAVVGGWLIALIFVVLFAALAGLLIGAPVIRMRGDYLAIVTLGFGEIIRLLFLSDWLSGYFGGAQGITNIEGADFGPLGTVSGIDPRSVFYLVLVFSAIAIYVSWRTERSRLGRAWMAIREDESVAEAMGINTVNMRCWPLLLARSSGRRSARSSQPASSFWSRSSSWSS